MEVFVEGNYLLAETGIVKEIQDTTIIFDVKGEDVEIVVTEQELYDIKEIISESEYALFPIDMKTKTILMNAEPLDKKIN